MKLPFICLLVLIALSLSAQPFIPKSSGEIITHKYFSLSYSEENEQPNWVYYKLTPEFVNGPVSRGDDFRPDPYVSTISAQLFDYKGSGYDRGHLCPAADMKISSEAMSESFFLSNMSPQDPSFNRGIWLKLEEAVRSIARNYSEIYVVTGPVFKDCLGEIGINHVTVPGYYYKVIFIPSQSEMLGMVLPNATGDRQLFQYALSVDSIESLTGIDFFPQLNDSIESLLESSIPNDLATLLRSSANTHQIATNPSSSGNHSSEVAEVNSTGSIPQCLGIAKSTGQRCKTRTTNENGYCNYHQAQVR